MKKSIFDIEVSEERLHPKFKHFTSEFLLCSEKEILESWANNFYDRDGKFIKEFQMHYHSSIWELYLSQVFHSLKFKQSLIKDRPDFIISEPEEMYVEAVVSNYRKSGRQEETRNYNDFEEMFQPIHKSNNFDIMMDESITRYSNSIQSKLNNFNDNYSKCAWINTEKPFLIALGAYDQIASGREFIYPMLALLYGEYLNNSNFEFERLVYTIKPGSDSKIDLGIFHKNEFENISAVIFSCTMTIGKLKSLALSSDMCKDKMNTVVNVKYWEGEPHFVFQVISENNIETLTDGLFIFHNPNAKNKINMNTFNKEDITQITYDYEEKTFRIISNDLPLVARVNFVSYNNETIINEALYNMWMMYNF